VIGDYNKYQKTQMNSQKTVFEKCDAYKPINSTHLLIPDFLRGILKQLLNEINTCVKKIDQRMSYFLYRFHLPINGTSLPVS